MDLTTVARVKMWAPVNDQSTKFDGLLRGQISAISNRLENYLKRHIQIAVRTQQLYVEPMSRRYFLRAAPVYSTTGTEQKPGGASITVAANATITYDPLRDFSSDPEDVLTYYIRNEEGNIEFDFPINYTGYRNPGAVKVTYYGGLAYTLDQLATTSLSHSGTISVGDTVTGSLSGAVGTVLAYTQDATITVRVLSGSFQVGENFVSGANTAVFTALTAVGEPLCMAYPELVEACNMEVAWWFQRRETMGLTNISNEGSTISMEKTGTLLQGVKDTIEHLVRYGTTY